MSKKRKKAAAKKKPVAKKKAAVRKKAPSKKAGAGKPSVRKKAKKKSALKKAAAPAHAGCYCRKITVDGETMWACFKVIQGGAQQVAAYDSLEECRNNCIC